MRATVPAGMATGPFAPPPACAAAGASGPRPEEGPEAGSGAAAVTENAAAVGGRVARRDGGGAGESDVWAAYLRDVERCQEPLAREEEAALIARAKAGDGDARERLTRSCLKLVLAICNPYALDSGDLMDLVGAGNEGLAEASRCKTFDFAYGLRFHQYAAPYVRKHVRAYVARRSFPLVPAGRAIRMQKAARAADRLRHRTGREPSPEEVGQEAGVEPPIAADAMRLAGAAVELDALPPERGSGRPGARGGPLGGGAGTVLGDDGADAGGDTPEEREERRYLRRAVREALAGLAGPQRLVLCLWCGIGQVRALSMREIAEAMGLDERRVKALRDEGLRALAAGGAARRLRALVDG